jgi:hypothetical protein
LVNLFSSSKRILPISPLSKGNNAMRPMHALFSFTCYAGLLNIE